MFVSYDCNGSYTQRWQWYNKSILSINDTDLSRWCLDAGDVAESESVLWRFLIRTLLVSVLVQNGVQMKIWQCFADLPQQSWVPSVDAAQSGPIALSVNNVCLDLTNGVDADRTILQIWQCVPGNTNQIWSYSAPLVI